MSSKNIKELLVVVAVGLFIGFVIFILSGSNLTSGPPPFIHPKVLLNPPDSIYNIPEITEGDHMWGSRNAPVKVVEYSDTECPFCKRNYINMKYLVNYYDGDVAWVYRHHTLDHRYTKSRTEAEASECAASVGGEGAFWLFLDEIYKITGSNDSLDLALLPDVVEKFGVDRTKFETCLENKEHAQLVEDANRDTFEAGIEFTPSMVIFWPDGERRSLIIGARNRETLQAAFDYILGREITPTNESEVGADEQQSYSE